MTSGERMQCDAGLRGMYTTDGVICIEGTIGGLSMLALSIEQAKDIERLPMSENVEPPPSFSWMGGIRVEDVPGKIRIHMIGNALTITGESKYRAILARNILKLRSGDHLHVEYHPDHFYLESTAEPLVLECL